MKVTIELDVDGCHNCPFKQYHYGHGESWYWCSHKSAPKGYDNILENRSTPRWCPIGVAKLEHEKPSTQLYAELNAHLMKKDIDNMDELLYALKQQTKQGNKQ
jgi:hypothetical protein